MKTINLLSLVQSHASLEKAVIGSFLDHYKIKIKASEISDLENLIDLLKPFTANNIIFDDFYVGYRIPQIGKEFDLLRIGRDFIVNIELKRTCAEDKAQKQLARNRYYLSSLGKPVYNWTFVSDVNQLYFLNDNDQVQLVDFRHLTQSLHNQAISGIEDLDRLFDPVVYLVSPFNSTERFVKDEYFLTHQQEDIKCKTIKSISFRSKEQFIAITGSAGTGKTLLIYDLVKEFHRIGDKTLVIHCGNLNEGQLNLINNHGWDITSIKYFNKYDLSSYDVIVVDEAQRIRTSQFNSIVTTVQSTKGGCIFSYDKLQTLSNSEELSKIDEKVSIVNGIQLYKLTEKIRTNIEIASFIKSVFDRNRNVPQENKGNIELNYFNNISDAREYLNFISCKEWEVLRFTPSQYDNEHHKQYSLPMSNTSHRVIGQEFDNVAVVIDEYFSYATDGRLVYVAGSYYHAVKMLFQNITRTRKKLNLVIINNPIILNRCLSVLKA